MKKYEHIKVVVNFDFEDKSKRLGLEGWKLISVCSNSKFTMTAFFRRRIT